MVKRMNVKYRTYSMKKLAMIAAFCCLIVSTDTFAQDRQRDPKKMSEMVAKRLDFSDDQNKQLTELNQKYTGDSYDKEAYKEDFKKIMTDDQKKQLAELRQKRMGNGRRGGVN